MTRSSHPPTEAASGASGRGRVLVLGHDTRSFLTVVRSLGRRGLEVHAAWCGSDSPARRSRYLHTVHELPPYVPGERAGIDALLELLAVERFDLVVPCNDPSILPIRHHRSEVERLSRICLPAENACEVTFDKIRTGELAATLGIRLPAQDFIEDIADVTRARSGLRAPLVLKPRSSYALDRLGAKATVQHAADWDDATERLRGLLKQGPVLVQERFEGIGAGVEVLALDGEILVAFQHVRVHEPPRGGGSSYRRSTAVAPELLEATERLMRAVQYTGVAMVEFRINPSSGDWIFVEINSRFWGSLPLAVAAGMDFPAYAYDMFVAGRRTFPSRYRTDLYCRNLRFDLTWLWSRLREERPSAALRTVTAYAFQFITNLLTLRERSDTFVVDDLRPALAEMGQVVASFSAGRGARIRLRLLHIPVLRQRRSAELLDAMKRAKNVLFVCKGNICRSPFAEHYARGAWGNRVSVSSCGHFPVAGRPSPELAAMQALQFGVDLRSHRSSLLTSNRVNEADIVFTFDQHNRREVLRQFPHIRHKVFDLGIIDSVAQIELADPYGTDAEGFRRSFTRIARSIDLIAASCGAESLSTILPARGETEARLTTGQARVL